MSLSGVLETAFGLIFVFFLFSVIASGVNETLGRWTKRRARFLERGLWRLLGDDLDRKDPPKAPVAVGAETTSWYLRFWDHALVRQLAEPGKRRPSYVPSRTFAAVVGNLFQQDARAGAAVLDRAPAALQESITTLIEDAREGATRLRENLEHWFDAEMDRVSGWYKRHTQRLLLVIGVVIVLSMNIDTVAIARTLWTDPQVRAAVSAAAEADVQANRGAAAPATAVVCSTKAQATTATTTVLKGATNCAASLPLPLGWRNGSMPKGVRSWLQKLLGFALSIGAIAMGAPFWWDLLNRFGSLKQSGPKPASTSTSAP